MNNENNEVMFAGFWRRTGSILIDLILFAPMFYLYFYMLNLGPRWSVILWISLQFLLQWFYIFYFNLKWGATLGKMVVRIKIVKVSDYSDIKLREAFLRSSVDLLIGILLLIGTIIGLLAISESDFAQGWGILMQTLQTTKPKWVGVIEPFFQVWTWGEVIVLLFNKKKRAIHDFIAGTVVIHKKTQPMFNR